MWPLLGSSRPPAAVAVAGCSCSRCRLPALCSSPPSSHTARTTQGFPMRSNYTAAPSPSVAVAPRRSKRTSQTATRPAERLRQRSTHWSSAATNCVVTEIARTRARFALGWLFPAGKRLCFARQPQLQQTAPHARRQARGGRLPLPHPSRAAAAGAGPARFGSTTVTRLQ